MSEIPEGLRYAESEEWAKLEGNIVTMGLTDHAQEQIQDIVYVELPEVGATVEKGKEFAIVESTKTAADVYAPVSGKVIEVNELLAEQPELMNQEPYGKGWLAKIETSDSAEFESLLSPAQYKEKIGEWRYSGK